MPRKLWPISGRESRTGAPTRPPSCPSLRKLWFAPRVPSGEEWGYSGLKSGTRTAQALADLKERFASLSPREREIVIQVARGRLSKQIAHEIGIAEATVKVHRSRAMQKMKASSLPELGRMADKLQLVSDEPQRS
jgi:DNA-binding CsgD family transcriptional regulator